MPCMMMTERTPGRSRTSRRKRVSPSCPVLRGVGEQAVASDARIDAPQRSRTGGEAFGELAGVAVVRADGQVSQAEPYRIAELFPARRDDDAGTAVEGEGREGAGGGALQCLAAVAASILSGVLP